MASVNLRFNQLLTGVRSRVEGEGRTAGLSIARTGPEHTDRPNVEPVKVVFTLQDFMEKKKKVEEEEKIGDSSDSDIEEVATVKNDEKDEDESSDESIVDDDVPMDDETDSDLELIKSEKTNEEMEEGEIKQNSKEDPDSDIDNEIGKLHDIIEELTDPLATMEEASAPPNMDDASKHAPDISEEATERKPKENSEDNSTRTSTVNEKVSEEPTEMKPKEYVEDNSTRANTVTEKVNLGKFSGLSIQKNTGTKSTDEIIDKYKDVIKEPTKTGKSGISISGLPPQVSLGTAKRKASESPVTVGEKEPKEAKRETRGRKKKASAAVPIVIEDDKPEADPELTLEEAAEKDPLDESDDNENSVNEFDLCTHGDLMYDYMCYECTYNRWRVDWNRHQPPEKQKARPEFVDISHRLNIGNLRNISIQRAASAAPPPPEKPERKPEPPEEAAPPPPKEAKPASSFKLPSGVRMSEAKPGGSAGLSFTKLPSGISFSTFKTADGKTTIPEPDPKDPTEETKPAPEEAPKPDAEASPAGEATQPAGEATAPAGEAALDPATLLKTIDWAQIFQLTGAAAGLGAAAL